MRPLVYWVGYGVPKLADYVWGVLEVVTKKETVCLAMQKECIGDATL